MEKIVTLKRIKHHEITIQSSSDCWDFEILRENGISRHTFYHWLRKYVGLEAKELKRIKELEEENARFKKMYANLALDLDLAKYIIEKSTKACHKREISKSHSKVISRIKAGRVGF